MSKHKLFVDKTISHLQSTRFMKKKTLFMSNRTEIKFHIVFSFELNAKP